MKRAIKFRAWDGEAMYQVHSAHFDPDRMRCLFQHGTTADGQPMTHMIDSISVKGPIQVMQFTGLLDKNGKEIYEGDVLAGQIDVGMENGLMEDVKFVVAWEYYGWGFTASPYECEVIGNICENPELIGV